ncbi:hypothetical protein FZ103_00285 [Streptomonospora sp. PA3]|uniref:hypothetical protein n=1 Tax=Streptomonospora sp. PA3 TaxID=2607326 RepID=UPI001306180B|nr:hypothetical protein [Streptomonospora sp. PA3]MUL39631.1 hypothetical protein [Streptomonospora sp. PA3]
MTSAHFRPNIAPAQRAGREGAEVGLGKGLEYLLGESDRLVPLEEGTLQRSGTTDQDGLSGTVSYDTVYAARQHEELTWRHDPGRQAKYLEQPASDPSTHRTIEALIGAEIRRRLRG